MPVVRRKARERALACQGPMGTRNKCVPFGFTFRLKLIMTRSDRYAIYPTASRWQQISSADSAQRILSVCALDRGVSGGCDSTRWDGAPNVRNALASRRIIRAQNLERMWKEDVLHLQTMMCPPDEYIQNQIACTERVLYQTREYAQRTGCTSTASHYVNWREHDTHAYHTPCPVSTASASLHGNVCFLHSFVQCADNTI